MPQTFDYELIRQLANILDETNLTEIEVEQEKLKIRVARTAAPVTIQQGGGWAAPTGAPAMAAPASAALSAEALKATDPGVNPGAVPSPMVGTAYLAAEPGVRAFVEVGDVVKEGQTVMIIEAMKHLNQIPAPRAGRVTAVLVENGQPVEFGEPLLIIE